MNINWNLGEDNVQGLGTVTFLTEQNEFGALGHGIHDTDTNGLMEISGGKLYRTTIQNVVKGSSGIPGTMEGMIVYNRYNLLGTIEKIPMQGFMADWIKPRSFWKKELVETAAKEEIVTRTGKDEVFLREDEVREFDIEVMKVDQETAEINKGMMIRVTDEELLEKTGGIIQGMSGSPILQNGKLIGAVTHVFVMDSTKGYGIFAETMLEQLK